MNNKKVPLRQCIGCGQMKSKKDLIRVIKTKEENILIDATGKMNGRGAYVCCSSECFNKAVTNRGLERSLKTSIPKEVYEQLAKELENVGSK